MSRLCRILFHFPIHKSINIKLRECKYWARVIREKTTRRGSSYLFTHSSYLLITLNSSDTTRLAFFMTFIILLTLLCLLTHSLLLLLSDFFNWEHAGGFLADSTWMEVHTNLSVTTKENDSFFFISCLQHCSLEQKKFHFKNSFKIRLQALRQCSMRRTGKRTI